MKNFSLALAFLATSVIGLTSCGNGPAKTTTNDSTKVDSVKVDSVSIDTTKIK
jgi:hypothetical protein